MPDPTRAPARRRSGLVHAAAWSTVGLAALGLTRLAYSVLVGRGAGAEALGAVNTLVSLVFLATLATAGAVGQAATRFVAEQRGAGGGSLAALRRRLHAWAVASTVVAAAVTVVLAPVLVPGTPSAGTVAALAALVLAYGGYSYLKGLIFGYQRVVFYAVAEIAADGVLLVVAAVVVLAAGAHAPGWLLVPLVVGYGLFCVFSVLGLHMLSRPGDGRLPDALSRSVRSYIGWTCLGMVASQGFFQACMVVAGHTLSPGEAGLYAAAMAAVTPAFFLPRSLSTAFFPRAARSVGAGNREEVARQTGRLTHGLVILTLPVFVIALVLAGPLLRLVFGPGFDHGAQIVQVLGAAVFLYVAAVPSVNALSAQGGADMRLPPLASGAGAVLGGAVLAYAVLGGHGGVGVAAGYLACAVVQSGGPLVLGRRRVGWDLAGREGRLAAACLLGAAAVVVAAVAGWRAGCSAAAVFAIAAGLLLRDDVRALVRRSTW